jgi:hypothetical protein
VTNITPDAPPAARIEAEVAKARAPLLARIADLEADAARLEAELERARS